MTYLSTSSKLKFLNFIKYPESSFDQGAFDFIVDKSGCGKNTYLKFLSGIIPSAPGDVLYRGKPVCDYSILEYRKQVLLLPQSVFLTDGTIRESFNFYYDNREQPRLSDQEMQTFLSVCCLDHSLDSPCVSLSGGERQRVFTAILLSLSALDETTSKMLFENIKAYCKTRHLLAICVCHSLDAAERFADRVINLGCGKYEFSY